jgi:hypothetical protein
MPENSDQSVSVDAKPQLPKLGFVQSVILILLCLFGARATVTALGFTGFRMMDEGVIWWQVLAYFAIAVTYYLIASYLVDVVRVRAMKSKNPNA